MTIEQRIAQLERTRCCGKPKYYNTFEDFPEEGAENNLYVDEETATIYIWNGTEYVVVGGGGIPYEPLGEYNTHAEATADVGLIPGSFYVLSVTNLEGVPSAGQAGPFYRKN